MEAGPLLSDEEVFGDVDFLSPRCRTLNLFNAKQEITNLSWLLQADD